MVELLLDSRDRRPEVRVGIVPEFEHARMAIERRLHDPALHAATAPVNEAYLAKSGGCGGVDVLRDDRPDVGRRERMEVEVIFNRQVDGIKSQNLKPKSQNCSN